MIRRLQTCVFKAVLVRSVARKNGRNVENNRSFLVSEGILRNWFVGESIEPGQR